MSNTLSNDLPLSTFAPKFELLDTITGSKHSYDELKGNKGTLILFICNHCPFVIHIINEIVQIANDYKPRGIKTIAISSNDIIKYPQDSPELMYEFAIKHTINFPYLYDESQEVAISYKASCTPDIFLFDAHDKLFYHGQLDDSRPGNEIPVTGKDLRTAIDALINNTSLTSLQKPSMGCNIKWK